MFSCFIEDLDFSMKTDQILLIVRFGKGQKLLSELLTVLNASKFMNMCNLRLELGSGS
jgi:hypothetical protein